MVQSTIMYQLKNLSIAINSVYKDRDVKNAPAINATVTKDYLLLNTKVSYGVSKKAKLFIACNNITDIKYSDLLGSNMPRRWTTGGFNISL